MRRGIIESHVLIYTSIAFALWHISAVILDTDFRPVTSQVPIFVSIIVASCSHGLWNGIAYVFFGFGTKTGALGIRDTAIFGPEIGILGLISNAVFAFLFWQWWRTRCNRT